MMNGTKNEKAWQEIIRDHPEILDAIDTHGYCDIESTTIKQYREPRLACYFDIEQKLPRNLKDMGLSVLAIRNGLYRMAHTRPFFDLPVRRYSRHRDKRMFHIPDHILTLSPSNISSEAKALDSALVSGMLDYVFQDTDVKLVIRGREMCVPIDFALPDVKVDSRHQSYHVEGVQIEVDGGFEGPNGLYLVEAKNYERPNISLRQVMYPHLHYESKLKTSKPVQSYVMFFDQKSLTYHFYQMGFDHFGSTDTAYDVASIRYEQCGLYRTDARKLNYLELLREVSIDNGVTDIGRPFPQADDFNKVLALFDRVYRSEAIHEDELFRDYSIVPRQFDYYGNAIRWLRVVDFDRHTRIFKLTNIGRNLGTLDSSELVFELAKIALSNDLFNQLYNGIPITESVRKRNRLSTYSMFHRRLQTAKAWVNYFKQALSHA